MYFVFQLLSKTRNTKIEWNNNALKVVHLTTLDICGALGRNDPEAG